MPNFLTGEQLQAEGLPIQTQYTPISRIVDLRLNETPSQYYERKGRLVKRIVEQNKNKGMIDMVRSTFPTLPLFQEQHC